MNAFVGLTAAVPTEINFSVEQKAKAKRVKSSSESFLFVFIHEEGKNAFLKASSVGKEKKTKKTSLRMDNRKRFISRTFKQFPVYERQLNTLRLKILFLSLELKLIYNMK